jgi:hypothetical protein
MSSSGTICRKCGRLNGHEYIYCSCGNNLEAQPDKSTGSKENKAVRTVGFTRWRPFFIGLILFIVGYGLGSLAEESRQSIYSSQEKQLMNAKDEQIKQLTDSNNSLNEQLKKNPAVIEKPVYVNQPTKNSPPLPKTQYCNSTYSPVMDSLNTKCTTY